LGDEVMATFVLVHGAWHGAWCWRRVARLLGRNGHEVFTPTLTGLAERSHLLTPEIGLDTHILDVVNEMKWQELNDVVLVGHSYAGMVISGVAEAMEKSIASIVFLDAFFPESGEALIDLTPPPIREAFLAAEREGQTTIPPRSAEMFNVNDRDRAWVDMQCTPQPVKCGLQKATLTGARERIAAKSYIRASAYQSPPFDLALAKARARGWHSHEVACGHDVMLDAPERLAEILHDASVPGR
jgi:pimeloyl-ACP methyl ester carboxylesterase